MNKRAEGDEIDTALIALRAIALKRPEVRQASDAVRDYCDVIGNSSDDDEITRAVERLFNDGLITVVSEALALEIQTNLDDIHGPLIPIPRYTHVSVTVKGGKLLEESRAERLIAQCVKSNIGHMQWFCLSRAMAREISRRLPGLPSPVVSRSVVVGPGLSPVDGLLIDFFGKLEATCEVAEYRANVSQQLLKRLSQLSGDVNEMVSNDEAAILLALSGYLGVAQARRCQDAKALPALANRGLVRRAERVDRESARSLASQERVLLDFVPRPGEWMATSDGVSIFQEMLAEHPIWRESFSAERELMTCSTVYFRDSSAATSSFNEAQSRGYVVCGMEEIGPWCRNWWEVYDHGYRFTAWNARSNDNLGRSLEILFY